jgi:hypothetical protein
VGDVELRTRDGRLHGVLSSELALEVKQGDRIYRYDLRESLAQRRPVYTMRLAGEPNSRRLGQSEGLVDAER